MGKKDLKICRIEDSRIAGYKKRKRSGAEQIFYTGDDERDFGRYHAEGGNHRPGVEMHDKPDTIRLLPPERHYHAQLVDEEWWWVNGCAECNGRPRSWITYMECEKHNVCRTCGRKMVDAEVAWGGRNGWQCGPCKDLEKTAMRAEAFRKMAEKEYDEWDYMGTEKIICPHCGTGYERDCEVPEGDEICELCGGEYTVEPEYTVTFTTKCKGERLTE